MDSAGSAHPRAAHWRALARTLAVWLGVLALFVYLYRNSTGYADAQAIAEAQQHRIATVDGGKLARIEVQAGQAVTQGQVLLRFSTEEVDTQIQALTAELERTSSTVGAAELAMNADNFGTERTLRQELEAAQGGEAELRASAARESAELRVLNTELRHEHELVRGGMARNDREIELDTRAKLLRESVRVAPSRLGAAQARRVASQQRLEQWQQRFASNAKQQPDDTRLRPLRDAVQEKRVALQGLKDKRAQMTLIAPTTGRVTSLTAQVGDVIRPGDTVLVLTEMASNRVVAYVAERTRLNLQAGQQVIIRRHAAPLGNGASTSGEVSAVATAITSFPPRLWPNPQQTTWGREVYIQLTPGAALSPGEMVDVSFLQPPLIPQFLPLRPATAKAPESAAKGAP